MGRDETAVLDGHLRVRGVEGLRVIDCSAMPGLVSGNTSGPAMALAWRACDLIDAERRALSLGGDGLGTPAGTVGCASAVSRGRDGTPVPSARDTIGGPLASMATGGHAQRRRWLSGSSLVVGAALVWSVWSLVDIAVALLVLAVPLTVLEALRPLRVSPRFPPGGRGHRRRELRAQRGAGRARPGRGARVAVPVLRARRAAGDPQPGGGPTGWARWLEAFVLSEVCGYWGHRASHEIPLLWRFHRVHHSAPELDWLAPNRRHPIDAVVALHVDVAPRAGARLRRPDGRRPTSR